MRFLPWIAPRPLVGIVLLTFVTLTGCGPATGELTGMVKSGSKLVVSGSVTAVGSDNIPHGAPIGADGRYRLSGLPLGDVKLLVSSPNPAGRNQGRPEAGKGGGRGGRGKEGRQPPPSETPPLDPEVVKKWFPISEDYGDLAKTTLRATVKPGSTTHDIELK
ncbi:MAG: carboxypeptidase-like regulatory domain-containing protein [Gemmataceae bacterium]